MNTDSHILTAEQLKNLLFPVSCFLEYYRYRILACAEDPDMAYYPLHREYVAVGALGIIFYSIIILSALTTLAQGVKSTSTQIFFLCFIAMAVMELPRYCDLAADGNYTSIAGYCCHIFAGNFFFLSFSIVCFQWCSLLEVGTYLRLIYSKHGLICANVLFFLVDLTAVCICATSPSLKSFFASDDYTAFQAIEGLKNCLYAGVLSYFGLRLIAKVCGTTPRRRGGQCACGTRWCGSSTASGGWTRGTDRTRTRDSDRDRTIGVWMGTQRTH
ncbi:hypothetical protein B484DRAFT_34253 [Ochromonadaceae sp. CCMP2298]|nr:hypothetical protein B484DRAFT_34253 [Ochromonadaceae sp. CCMP2298]